MPRNIELKVVSTKAELTAIRERLAKRPLPPFETIRQTDVYFRVGEGRLKLRTSETDGAAMAELIQYDRADKAGARISTYRRIRLTAEVGVELERALGDALGVLVRVRKRRTIAIWRSTRIHLDDVEGLGQFVELETVLEDGIPREAGQSEFDEVVEWLGLADLPSIPGSYCDLKT